MTRPKRDAMAKLDDAVEDFSAFTDRSCPAWRTYRRALNALLRERAEAAVNDARSSKMRLRESPEYWAAFEETIRAAVLGRSK
jgi:hypothetical protein